MTKKSKILIIASLLLSSLLVFNWACKKDDENIEPEEFLTTENSNLKTFEIANLNFTGILSEQTYTGKFGDKDIKINKNDSTLSFLVPDISTGQYNLLVNINEIDYSVSFNITQQEQVTNPEQYLTNLNTEVISLIDNTLEFTQEMLANGQISQADANADLAYWNEKKNKILDNFGKLTESEKQEFANFYVANKYWIDELRNNTSASYYKGSDNCKTIYSNYEVAIKNNKPFEAAYLGLKYKFCKTDTYQSVTKNTNKASAGFKYFNIFSSMRDYYEDIVGSIMDRLSKEYDTSNDEAVGEEIEDVETESNKKSNKSILEFDNDVAQNVYANIRYRAVNQSDINSGNSFARFASIFNDFIEAYNEYSSLISDALVYKPQFSNNTAVIAFNRFMTISNISNSNVSVKKSEIVDDKWQVTFTTEADDDQDFNFDILYDDGKIQLSKTVSATLEVFNCYCLRCISGYGQVGHHGETLDEPIVYKVEDYDGNPCENVTIYFSVEEGSTSATELTTGADGLVSVMWSMGNGVNDTQTLEASAYKSDGITHLQNSPYTISAHPGDPPVIEIINVGVCNNEDTYYDVEITFSYYDPNGSPLDNWGGSNTYIQGSVYTYDYPTLISGTTSDGVFKFTSYNKPCCCSNYVYGTEENIWVGNSFDWGDDYWTSIPSNVVTFVLHEN